MASPTVSATNSLAKQSRVVMSSHSGARLRVASTTTTTIDVDSVAELSDITLYSAGTPGMVVILEGVAGTDAGKTANITGITGTTLTVDVDLTTALADDDIIAVLPPQAVELFTNGGHGLGVTINNDDTRGLGETFLTHNTPLDVAVSGDIPFFCASDSPGLGRILAAGVGAYKLSTDHYYRPLEADDGTFSELEDFTVYAQDGNGIVRQVFYGLFGTSLNLTFPQSGIATGSLSCLGNGAVREVGGAGKTFPTGAGNWDDSDVECDTGSRHNFRGVFMELGGSFGDALTSAVESMVQDVSISIERGALSDGVLGDEFIVKPEEDMHGITISGTRILADDTFYEAGYGGNTAAGPGTKTETRILLKAVLPSDAATKTLTIDIPRAIFSSNVVNRQQGRFTEAFTITGIQTLDSDGCVDTANPLYEIVYSNSDATNYATAI